jgi:hypothetical protein
MVDRGLPASYAEQLALAVATTAGKVNLRPLSGHRGLELLPARFRFWAVPGFDYPLVCNAEHPDRPVLRVVHMARDLGPLLAGLFVPEDPEQP